MNREYLLKAIRRHFCVLNKDEIVMQIKIDRPSLPDAVIDALQDKLSVLNDESKLKDFNPIFCSFIASIRERVEYWDNGRLTIPGRGKLFDDTLLMISVYFHYRAVVDDCVMFDFLRFVLIKKILLT